MLRLIIVCAFTIGLSSNAFAEMSDGARRDFIAVCMFAGGFKVEGHEPPITDLNGNVDVSRTVKSWVDLFSSPDDKLRAGREIRKCVQQVIDANSIQPRQSRITAQSDNPAYLSLSIDPLEYAKGVFCSRPDIGQQLKIASLLRQNNRLNPETQKVINQFLGSIFGLDFNSTLVQQLLTLNMNDVDCHKERICEIRGSVPVEIRTNTMSVLSLPMREVKVMAGNCQGKSGFVSESLISY